MTPARRNGFTLIELLVVLVLMSLAASVATPALLRMADAAERKTARDQVRNYMQQLPVLAMNRGRALELLPTRGYRSSVWLAEQIESPLPDTLRDAEYALDAPILYRSNGACTGGIMHWRLGDQELRFQMEPPLCLLGEG